MLSEGGRCKTFDATADGYSRGEGGVGKETRKLLDLFNRKLLNTYPMRDVTNSKVEKFWGKECPKLSRNRETFVVSQVLEAGEL